MLFYRPKGQVKGGVLSTWSRTSFPSTMGISFLKFFIRSWSWWRYLVTSSFRFFLIYEISHLKFIIRFHIQCKEILNTCQIINKRNCSTIVHRTEQRTLFSWLFYSFFIFLFENCSITIALNRNNSTFSCPIKLRFSMMTFLSQGASYLNEVKLGSVRMFLLKIFNPSNFLI